MGARTFCWRSRDVVGFVVFFSIAMGLGYAPLARYDARTHGNPDALHYHAMVEGRPVRHPNANVFRARVLVPGLASFVRPALVGRVGSWNPTALALLLVNAAFVAASASTIAALARRIDPHESTGLVAALLYLSSFAITNFHLAGHVDSAEGFCFAALTYVCATGRHSGLVPLAALAALAKEAVLPLGAVFVAAWSWRARRDGERLVPARLALAASAVGLLVFLLARRVVLGRWFMPWDVAREMARPSWMQGLRRAFDRSALYVFGWLAPLGLSRVREAPAPWSLAVLAASLSAFAMAVWSHGTAVRLVFDVAAPLLSIGAARALLGAPQRGASPSSE